MREGCRRESRRRAAARGYFGRRALERSLYRLRPSLLSGLPVRLSRLGRGMCGKKLTVVFGCYFHHHTRIVN